MHSKRRFTCPLIQTSIKDYRFFKAKMVFFVGRPETSPDSITQEWITTQRLIQKEASDKRDLVQTGQHLLKFMNVINSACRGAFNNYVDMILTFFAPPPCVDNFIPWTWTKTDIFWPPPSPSSCPRSYWMAPK